MVRYFNEVNPIAGNDTDEGHAHLSSLLFVTLSRHYETGVIQTVADIGINDFFKLAGNATDQRNVFSGQKSAHDVTDAGADDFANPPAGYHLNAFMGGHFFKGQLLPADFMALFNVNHHHTVT